MAIEGLDKADYLAHHLYTTFGMHFTTQLWSEMSEQDRMIWRRQATIVKRRALRQIESDQKETT